MIPRSSSPFLVAVAALLACGGEGTGHAVAPPGGQVVAVAVAPKTGSTGTGGSLAFSATVTGTANTSVAWSVEPAGCGSVSSGGLFTAPGSAGTCFVVAASAADPSRSGRATVTVTSSSAGRPAYNTGVGFYVRDGRLYDANGVEFAMRGVNRAHWDRAWPGIAAARANTVRISMPIWSQTDSVGVIQATVAAGMVPMPGVWFLNGSWDYTAGLTPPANVTYDDRPEALAYCVDLWVARAAAFKPFERYMLLNIANEWGPVSSVWRDSYITAIQRLRGVHPTLSNANPPYLGTIVIDAGGSGQGYTTLVDYASALMDADPQHNLVFDVHIYNYYVETARDVTWGQYVLTDAFDALAALGLPIVVGEFGAGDGTDYLGTTIPAHHVIPESAARGFGWLAWAWDDGANDDSALLLPWDGETYVPGTAANRAGGLTTFGTYVVEDATYGLRAVSVPATIFGAATAAAQPPSAAGTSAPPAGGGWEIR